MFFFQLIFMHDPHSILLNNFGPLLTSRVRHAWPRQIRTDRVRARSKLLNVRNNGQMQGECDMSLEQRARKACNIREGK